MNDGRVGGTGGAQRRAQWLRLAIYRGSIPRMIEIPIVRGTKPPPHSPEFAEMMKYESGEASVEASKVPGRHSEPWLNVVEAYEPASPPALDMLLSHPATADHVRGRAIDLGAGTCWVAGRLSSVPRVDEVVALDLSEGFLTSVGARVIRAVGGDTSKVRFAVSSFNEIPFGDGYFDCAFLVAAIHHSVTPLRTLLEVKRVLRPGGSLFFIETLTPVLAVERARRSAIQISRDTGATEIVYTRGELEYLLRHAGFDDLQFVPCDALSTNRLKLWARRALRACHVEHHVAAVSYVIRASRRS